MVGVVSKPDTYQKLAILSEDAQYDLACACGDKNTGHRKRTTDGNWIYPVTLANGGRDNLLKTLMSNVCSSDCTYCPLRSEMDVRRCSLSGEQVAKVFMDYYRNGKVFGLFLSSGICGNADNTMDKIISAASILRTKHKFKGYIHLKIIPGASKAAIEKTLSVASAVSLNIETPGAEYLRRLSKTKNFQKDIVDSIRYISNLTARGNRFAGKKQTTQFIVGAAGENDAQIVKYTAALYQRLGLNRVYFSSYQKTANEELFVLKSENETQKPFIREHRLYQADFLLRKYGFSNDDILFDSTGQLSLEKDPKQLWADKHPEFFPLPVNYATKNDLLRVPGLGPVTVNRVLKMRKIQNLTRLEDFVKLTARTAKADKYLSYK